MCVCVCVSVYVCVLLPMINGCVSDVQKVCKGVRGRERGDIYSSISSRGHGE